MTGKLSDFMKKRRSSRLYRQWVEMNGLPPEEIPQESPDEGRGQRGYYPDDDYNTAGRSTGFDSRTVTLPTRHVLAGLGVIALLLIVLAIVSTVLIMQSC